MCFLKSCSWEHRAVISVFGQLLWQQIIYLTRTCLIKVANLPLLISLVPHNLKKNLKTFETSCTGIAGLNMNYHIYLIYFNLVDTIVTILIIIIYHAFLPPLTRGSHVKLDNTHNRPTDTS